MFAFVTIFEYLYPISAFCTSAKSEVAHDTSVRLKILFRQPDQIVENFMRKLGSILMNTMTVPDCFRNNTLNGTCSGTKVGSAVNYLLLVP